MAIIEVNHVTKEYRLGHMKSLKQSVLGAIDRLRGRPAPKQEPFKALDDVDFKVKEGEVLGIIGTNGAGKSTLLKLLARVSVPTKGDIKVRGSVAPLIEVGAGLVGDLTGRENIYLNGSILGLSIASIKKKFDEIVEFAELEEFIDTPIKRYSSGMMIRLGFSIATSVDADILIIDEVLAVGDLAFQRKCFDRMENMIKQQGKTVLIVGHNIRQLERICSRLILLDHGKVLLDGRPADIATAYYKRTNEKILQSKFAVDADTRITSSGEIELIELALFADEAPSPSQTFNMHQRLRVSVKFRTLTPITEGDFGFGFHTSDFVYITTFHTGNVISIAAGEHTIEAFIPDLPLMPGVYGIRAGFHDKNFRVLWYGENITTIAVNAADSNDRRVSLQSLIDLPASWKLPALSTYVPAKESRSTSVHG